MNYLCLHFFFFFFWMMMLIMSTHFMVMVRHKFFFFFFLVRRSLSLLYEKMAFFLMIMMMICWNFALSLSIYMIMNKHINAIIIIIIINALYANLYQSIHYFKHIWSLFDDFFILLSFSVENCSFEKKISFLFFFPS